MNRTLVSTGWVALEYETAVCAMAVQEWTWVCVFWLGVCGCRTRGICVAGRLGICGAGNAGLVGIGVGFLELVYGIGDPRKNVWGDGLCGEPRKTYGEMRQAWERRRRMGGRQAAWGAKTALKPGIWERWRPAGFACFYEFLAGGGGMAFATVKASRGACCECSGA